MRKYSILENPGILAARTRQSNATSVVNKLKSSEEASGELERITKTGWLTKDRKKGDDDKRKSKWERRWFVLRSTRANYYEDAECKKPKGEIPLDVCFVQEDTNAQGAKDHEPQLKLVTGGRTLYFMADTSEETESWISAIKTNIALNSYLKKSIMTKNRIDPRVGDFACSYQSLENLIMEREWITLEAMVALQHPLKDCHCNTISFEASDLEDLQVQVLATALAENKTCRILNLSKNAIGDSGAQSLADALKKNKSITNVILSGNEIKEHGALSLASVLGLRKDITKFGIDRNPIGDPGVISFCKALSNKDINIPVLNLSSTEMGDAGCQAVAELLKLNPNIIDVFLSYNHITNNGIVDLAKALEKVTNVQVIDVSCNVFEEKGAVALAKMLENNSKILSVSIGGNRLYSGKLMSEVIATVATDSKLIFPMLAFERQAASA